MMEKGPWKKSLVHTHWAGCRRVAISGWVVNVWLDGLCCVHVCVCLCTCWCCSTWGVMLNIFLSYIVVSFLHDWFWSWKPIFLRANYWGCCWIIYDIFKLDWFAICVSKFTTTHGVLDAWNVRASILALTFEWLHM